MFEKHKHIEPVVCYLLKRNDDQDGTNLKIVMTTVLIEMTLYLKTMMTTVLIEMTLYFEKK